MQRLASKTFTSTGTFTAPGGVNKVLISFYYNNSKLNLSFGGAGTTSTDHGSALNSIDGSAWAWGANANGQLGNNASVSTSSPISVVGNISFSKLATGNLFNSSIRASDGSSWTWGANANGQLGDNTVTNRSSPVSVVGTNSFIQISSSQHSLAIRGSDGSAWAWGTGTSGQLGNSSVTNRSSPVSVVGTNSFVQVSAGISFSVGIRGSDGSAWAWGDNAVGELGLNSIASNTSPASVLGSNSYTKISSGNHTIAIRGSDGSAWCWGNGTLGQIGNGGSTNKSSPVSVSGNNSYITIAAGDVHSAAIRGSDGSAWCWGFGSSGQVGNNSISLNPTTPSSVVGNHSFVNIFAGNAVTHAVKADGSLWAWGSAVSGQLGDNTGSNKSSPVMIVPIGSSEGSEKESSSTILMSVTPGTAYVANFTGGDVINFNGFTGFGTSISISWAE